MMPKFASWRTKPDELWEKRQQILKNLDYPTDIVAIVERLNIAQCTYLLNIYQTEAHKAERDFSFQVMLGYLEDPTIQRDKDGIRKCIFTIADKIFSIYLDVLSRKPMNKSRDVVLEDLAILLLVKFNHPQEQVRRWADKYLSLLVDRFPHMLWSGRVLATMLDILKILKKSSLDSAEDYLELSIPNTKHKIMPCDTKKARETIFRDFTARCNGIIREAVRWAPRTTRSHLIQYGVLSGNLGQHPCLSLVTESTDCPDLLVSFGYKEQISCMVTNMILTDDCKKSEAYSKLANVFRKELRNSCVAKDLERHNDLIYKITALLIVSPGCNRELLKVLCWAPLDFFNAAGTQTIVTCWDWFLAARGDLEMEFALEMVSAWDATIRRRLGMFAVEPTPSDPLAAVDGVLKEVQHPPIGAHHWWLRFASERIETSKYNNTDLVELYSNMLHKSMTLTVGALKAPSRNMFSIGCRFKLLNCGLSLIQSETVPRTYNNLILRERIYQTALDYFCGPQVSPLQRSADLREDIITLIKFWQSIHSDRKYLKYLISIPPDSATDMPNFPLDSYSKECTKRRNLILSLLANEIEFLQTWYNPLACPDMHTPSDKLINEWQTQTASQTTERQASAIREHVKLAWEISPTLAVYLPHRFKSSSIVTEELSKLVKLQPTLVSHIPEAIQYLITPNDLVKDSPELLHVITWAPVQPIIALSFFSLTYPPHPFTHQYAIRSLCSYPSEVVMTYIPQLVQALRYDKMGYLKNYIRTAAKRSQLLMHQLIWNMRTSMYRDENGQEPDPNLYGVLDELVGSIIESLSGPSKILFEKEFDFVRRITSISGEIRDFPKGEQRREALLNALKKFVLEPGCYLPSSADSIVTDIDREFGIPLQSAAKAPFLTRFKVIQCGINQVEQLSMDMISKSQQKAVELTKQLECDASVNRELWQAAIFKVGDDVRQDMLVLQLIELLRNIFARAGLDLYLHPYRVVATSPGCGVIECVPNAKSREQLGKETEMSLYDYFRYEYGDETSKNFQEARANFVKSMAAYSIVGYLFQVKDRHNGNIMIDSSGRIIHIDFGFVFDSSPGGNLGFEPDIKLTEEMVKILGGNMDAPPFKKYRQLCVQAYLAVRPYREAIVAIVQLMLETSLPCFRGQTIKLLRMRFAPECNDKDASNYILKIIRDSYLSFRTRTYDMLQYYQNSIPY